MCSAYGGARPHPNTGKKIMHPWVQRFGPLLGQVLLGRVQTPILHCTSFCLWTRLVVTENAELAILLHLVIFSLAFPSPTCPLSQIHGSLALHLPKAQAPATMRMARLTNFCALFFEAISFFLVFEPSLDPLPPRPPQTLKVACPRPNKGVLSTQEERFSGKKSC